LGHGKLLAKVSILFFGHPHALLKIGEMRGFACSIGAFYW
jgi:hypothetical protein